MSDEKREGKQWAECEECSEWTNRRDSSSCLSCGAPLDWGYAPVPEPLPSRVLEDAERILRETMP